MAPSASDPEPPWRRYPGSDAFWSGWRQGESEAWLLRTWLPFWRGLSSDDRAGYLRRWPPPDEGWCRALTEYWA